jgi:hypothetical protein
MSDNNDNMVKIGFSIMQLTGIGTEYLVIDEEIIAKFYNGNLIYGPTTGNDEKTVISA